MTTFWHATPNSGSYQPALEHTVHASTLEQSHRFALEAGASFYGVPPEQITATPTGAHSHAVSLDGTVLVFAVDFTITIRT